MRWAISALRTQMSGITQALASICRETEALVPLIDEFAGNEELQGNRYENAKEYFASKYRTLVRGILLICRQGLESSMNCSSCLTIIQDSELKIDTDLVEENVQKINELIAEIEANLLDSRRNFLTQLYGNLGRLEAVVSQVYDFDAAANGLYDEMKDCIDAVSQGISELSNVHLDRKSKTFSYQPGRNPWAREIDGCWNLYKTKIKNIDYKVLHGEYWNRGDGYFEGNWWQDEEKLKEAVGILELEALLLGKIDLLGIASAYKNTEQNNRMYALEALSNALREGVHGDGLHNALENHFAMTEQAYADKNYSLNYADLQYLKKKYEEIIYKKMGKQLEGGWGDVIDGLMLLGGAVIIKKIAETPVNVSQVGNEGTGVEIDNFVKKNVNPNFQENVKKAFTPEAKVKTYATDKVAYRYHGGDSSGKSYWYTPKKTANPAKDLALPSGNSCQYVDKVVIPKGTTVIEGPVAPNFGQPGGGLQIYVPDPSVVKGY